MESRTILNIVCETGEEKCNVDIPLMHETLLNLPAEKYLELYHMMKDRIENKVYVIPELPKGGVLDCVKPPFIH